MTCILPVGSYEQHGPHMPPTVDAEVAWHVARRIAEAVGGRPLPPIYYSCSDEHRGFPNTVSVDCHTFLRYLEAVVESALDWCGRVVVVGGHGGIAEAISMVASQINYRRGPRVLAMNIWRLARVRDHAGTDETSVYMAVGGNVGDFQDICEGDVSLFGLAPVSRLSRSGVVGCLKRGEVSAERGAALLSKIVEEAVKKTREFLSLSSALL